VVIARDINVKNMKGKAPYHNENERRQAIIDTKLADLVVLGDERDFLKVIREYSPHILGFGYDQRVNLEDLKKEFPAIKMVRLSSYKPHKYKSSLIKAELPA
jgi:glycerol-3-phosphate cytidylyltransferase-like family protein